MNRLEGSGRAGGWYKHVTDKHACLACNFLTPLAPTTSKDAVWSPTSLPAGKTAQQHLSVSRPLPCSVHPPFVEQHTVCLPNVLTVWRTHWPEWWCKGTPSPYKLQRQFIRPCGCALVSVLTRRGKQSNAVASKATRTGTRHFPLLSPYNGATPAHPSMSQG